MADAQPATDIVAVIQKKFGTAAIGRLGDAAIAQQIGVISTGSIGLDAAIGVGGWPRGRIVEAFGWESSGKTTLALHAVANAQALGMQAAFVDAEHALDVRYAAALAVDVPKLIISQPDYGEQAMDIITDLAASGQVGIIVVDSVAALVPKAELEGEAGDYFVGVHARLMSQMMRRLAGVTSRTDTLVFFINQNRSKVAMGGMGGPTTTTTGGNALKFYASVRVDVARIGKVHQGSGDDAAVIGNRTRVKVAKNKLAPPFRECEFDIDFGRGVSREGEALDAGVEAGVVTKAGAWYSVGAVKLGQGREAAKATLRVDPTLVDGIRAEVLKKVLEKAAAK